MRLSNDSPVVADPLSRRERQIMDIIYAKDTATAREVLEDLPDPPSYATVRTLLRVLVEKGELGFKKKGRAFIYSPCKSRKSAAKTAWRRMIQTFYDGSVRHAIAGLLDGGDTRLDPREIQKITELLEKHESENKVS